MECKSPCGRGARPCRGSGDAASKRRGPVEQQGAPTFFLRKKKVGKEKPRLRRRRVRRLMTCNAIKRLLMILGIRLETALLVVSARATSCRALA